MNTGRRGGAKYNNQMTNGEGVARHEVEFATNNSHTFTDFRDGILNYL